MFDFAWSELLVIAIVAMVVIGPRDLPKLLYSLGQWVRKARSMVSEFQDQMEEIGRQDEIDSLRKELEEANRKIEQAGNIDGNIAQDIGEVAHSNSDAAQGITENPSDKTNEINKTHKNLASDNAKPMDNKN